MRIDRLINELKQVRSDFGNIEVTCTGSTIPDDSEKPIPDVFESTVENLVVQFKPKGNLKTRVRLYM